MKRYENTDHPHIKCHTKSRMYYFRGTINGQFIERSLKTTSFARAKEREKKVIGLAMGADIASQVSVRKRVRFSEAFDLVLKLQSTKHENTYQQAHHVINGHLRDWFQIHCPFMDRMEKSYEEVWAEYQLDQQKLKPRKLEHDRRYLVMALRRGFLKGWIKKQFSKSDFMLNEVSDPIGRYVTDAEIRLILMAAVPYPRLYLQILMAIHMGMRISEILHLRKDEINFERQEITLDAARLKIRRPREVPVPIAKDVYSLLKKAYEDAPGIYIFPAWFTNLPGQPIDPNQPQDDNRQHWDLVRTQTGIKLRFHDLRHTAITNMLKAGMPDVAVRKIVGASEITIRRVYAHIESDMQSHFRNLFSGKFVESGKKYGKLRQI